MRVRLLLPLMMIGLSAPAATGQSLTFVGDLPGGFPVSYAIGTSKDGSVVTGYSYSSEGVSGFRWTANDGISELNRSNGAGVYDGLAVSPNGEYILGRYQGLGSVWTEATGTVQIGDLPGGIEASSLRDINDSGLAVGQASHGFNSIGAPTYRAVRWNSTDGLVPMPLPAGDEASGLNSDAKGILSDGRIYGESASGAWIYSEDTGFEMLPGAEGLGPSNSDGSFIVGIANDSSLQASVAAYWTPDDGLQHLPRGDIGVSGAALSMSDDGSIIVGRLGTQQVVWIDQGEPMLVTDYAASLGIDVSDFGIFSVYGVSADGTTIVGGGRRLSWEGGRVEGFVLTIPAPGTIGVLGVAFLAARRRR